MDKEVHGVNNRYGMQCRVVSLTSVPQPQRKFKYEGVAKKETRKFPKVRRQGYITSGDSGVWPITYKCQRYRTFRWYIISFQVVLMEPYGLHILLCPLCTIHTGHWNVLLTWRISIFNRCS